MQSEKIGWINKWTDGLNGAGYSAFLRKGEPYELTKLNPRPLLTIPGDADGGRKAALEAKNAEIEHTNSINKAEKEARVLEVECRIASKLSAAMRDTARSV